MAILDFFKKEGEEKKPAKKVPKKPAKSGAALEKKKEAPKKKEMPAKKGSGLAHNVLISPHITEKATNLNESNKYVFKIFEQSNKIEVKKAIEGVYGVDVEKVRIINIPRKKRRVGRTTGWTKGYKKAIVTIKEGQKIEILSH
jgi:large subunit ribosomal protein L23